MSLPRKLPLVLASILAIGSAGSALSEEYEFRYECAEIQVKDGKPQLKIRVESKSKKFSLKVTAENSELLQQMKHWDGWTLVFNGTANEDREIELDPQSVVLPERKQDLLAHLVLKPTKKKKVVLRMIYSDGDDDLEAMVTPVGPLANQITGLEVGTQIRVSGYFLWPDNDEIDLPVAVDVTSFAPTGQKAELVTLYGQLREINEWGRPFLKFRAEGKTVDVLHAEEQDPLPNWLADARGQYFGIQGWRVERGILFHDTSLSEKQNLTGTLQAEARGGGLQIAVEDKLVQLSFPIQPTVPEKLLFQEFLPGLAEQGVTVTLRGRAFFRQDGEIGGFLTKGLQVWKSSGGKLKISEATREGSKWLLGNEDRNYPLKKLRFSKPGSESKGASALLRSALEGN